MQLWWRVVSTGNELEEHWGAPEDPLKHPPVVESGKGRGAGRQARTHRAFLPTEEQSAIAAIHVGHADVVTISPVELPVGKSQEGRVRVLLFPAPIPTMSHSPELWTDPRSGWTTRPWGCSSPCTTAFLKEPSSRATLICFLLVS